MGPEDWEGAAAELLDATCTTAPVDVLQLAAACGLDVRQGRGHTDGTTLFVDLRARPERVQGHVAHELGHLALERAGLEQDERGATYVGGALRLPRREMMRDLRETAWSIEALRVCHPNASATAIAVRITQLRTAVLALFDPHGRTPPWRVASNGVCRELARRPTPLEHELAIEAWVEQREVRRDEFIATPLRDYLPGEHRVLVVGHARGLRVGYAPIESASPRAPSNT